MSGGAQPRIEADWLRDEDVVEVLAALEAEGATALFVGGCVRNALIGAGATDIDVAIDREPDEATRLLTAAGYAVAPTGVEHGTITTITRRRRTPIEVTSFRRDVETDGRRAVVAFTRDIAEDAMRRDFTMNALYADAGGRVLDPLNQGLADLAARRVRFIGRAEDRIREDALRILRFFRFTARFGSAATARAEDVAAITRLVALLDILARERVGQELKKLFGAPDPVEALALAEATGALARALAPATPPVLGALPALLAAEAEAGAEPYALRRMALTLDADLAQLTERLRLSRAEAKRLGLIRAALSQTPAEAGYRGGAEAARDAALIRAAREGAPLAPALDAIALGAAAICPVAAADLTALGFRPGPGLGAALRRVEAAWIESAFTLSKPALLALAAAIKGETA